MLPTLVEGDERSGPVAWFRKLWRSRATDDDDVARRETRELLDQYHQRASIRDGDQILIAPRKVLDNIANAMERVDLDITTEISIEDDVVPTDELMNLVDNLAMGPTLAVHVVNNAMRVMTARYPQDLVRRPLPTHYDLRLLTPMVMDDQVHETARTIFNRRTTSAVDLTEDDVTADLAPLGAADQMTVFVALFCMCGTKVGAMKTATGID